MQTLTMPPILLQFPDALIMDRHALMQKEQLSMRKFTMNSKTNSLKDFQIRKLEIQQMKTPQLGQLLE